MLSISSQQGNDVIDVMRITNFHDIYPRCNAPGRLLEDFQGCKAHNIQLMTALNILLEKKKT